MLHRRTNSRRIDLYSTFCMSRDHGHFLFFYLLIYLFLIGVYPFFSPIPQNQKKIDVFLNNHTGPLALERVGPVPFLTGNGNRPEVKI